MLPPLGCDGLWIIRDLRAFFLAIANVSGFCLLSRHRLPGLAFSSWCHWSSLDDPIGDPIGTSGPSASACVAGHCPSVHSSSCLVGKPRPRHERRLTCPREVLFVLLR